MAGGASTSVRAPGAVRDVNFRFIPASLMTLPVLDLAEALLPGGRRSGEVAGHLRQMTEQTYGANLHARLTRPAEALA